MLKLIEYYISIKMTAIKQFHFKNGYEYILRKDFSIFYANIMQNGSGNAKCLSIALIK